MLHEIVCERSLLQETPLVQQIVTAALDAQPALCLLGARRAKAFAAGAKVAVPIWYELFLQKGADRRSVKIADR